MTAMLTEKPLPGLRERYEVSIQEFTQFKRDGYIVIRGLLSPEEVEELKQHTDDLRQGRLPEQNGGGRYPLDAPPAHLSAAEKSAYYLRIHMLHRKLELHERTMLHPRVLDVLEVLIGPDVMALQTMLFLKPPGKPGQGWHQDSYYIPTAPDTLCGAWIAIDDCDEQNGAMWFAKGSGNEPVYPPCPEVHYGFGDKLVGDIKYVKGVSDPVDEQNALTPVAEKYDHLLASAKGGDVVFFNGHVLHRSKTNWTSDRFRRSFVSHYANARSFTQWGADVDGDDVPMIKSEENIGSFTQRVRTAGMEMKAPPPRKTPPADKKDPITGMTNGSHILARGDTHLPFAKPRFGTPCAALLPPEVRAKEFHRVAKMIQVMNNGLLGCAIADPNLTDDDDHEPKEAPKMIG